jgi:hypothetical protein
MDYMPKLNLNLNCVVALNLNCVVANIDANKTKTISRTVYNRITGIEFTKKYKLINKYQNK